MHHDSVGILSNLDKDISIEGDPLSSEVRQGHGVRAEAATKLSNFVFAVIQDFGSKEVVSMVQACQQSESRVPRASFFSFMVRLFVM